MKLVCELPASPTDLTDPIEMKISFHSTEARKRTWKFLLVLDTVFAQQPVHLMDVTTEDAVGVLEISSSPLTFLADLSPRILENIALLEISTDGEVLERFVISMSLATWKKQLFQK